MLVRFWGTYSHKLLPMSSRLEYTRLPSIFRLYDTLIFVSLFSTDNGPDTEIGLKIVFLDLVYDSDKAVQWKTVFSNKVR